MSEIFKAEPEIRPESFFTFKPSGDGKLFQAILLKNYPKRLAMGRKNVKNTPPEIFVEGDSCLAGKACRNKISKNRCLT
ncbi:hypothetical protein LJC24_05165 [Desulfococcaceae bacterium OttesenSCG-928-F15]|nr:hypothetical protein [Desulfococcaceae bacterium OttesenSCG-928-F15]